MAENQHNILFVQMNLKEYEKAFSDFNKAIELEPGFREAYLNRELAAKKIREKGRL